MAISLKRDEPEPPFWADHPLLVGPLFTEIWV